MRPPSTSGSTTLVTRKCFSFHLGATAVHTERTDGADASGLRVTMVYRRKRCEPRIISQPSRVAHSNKGRYRARSHCRVRKSR
jgi:hypothetical protein